MWDVSEFLERAPTSSAMSFAEMIKLTISWRAHLMKIVSMLYVDTSGTLITASNDGSVRLVAWKSSRFNGRQFCSKYGQ